MAVLAEVLSKLIPRETDANRLLRDGLNFVTLFFFLAPVLFVFFRVHRGAVIRSMIVVSAILLLFSTSVNFIDSVHFFDAWPLIGAHSPVSQPLEDVTFVGGIGSLLLAFLLSALSVLAAGKQLAEEVAHHERTNRALGESEEKYRSLVETTDTGYLILDGAGRVIDANPEYVRLTGHQTLAEILGRSVVEWTATHDQERNAQEVEKCFDLGFVRNLQIDYLDSAGKITPIEINAKVVQAEDGVRTLSLCRDITERKLAEEALRESEENFRAIYDSANDAIFVHDVETGRIVDVNRTMCEMYGYTPEEARSLDVKGSSSGEPPYDEEHAMERVKKAILGEPQVFEWHARDKAGRLFWVEVSLKRVTIGKNDRILAIVRDITERKQAEEALRESEENFHAIFDGANDAIFIHDMEAGRIIDVNAKMCEMYGYPPEEARLASVEELSSGEPPYDQERAAALIKNAITGEPQIFEWHARDKAGRLFWVEVNLKRAAIGNDDRILAIVRDITERKRAEEALRESEERFAQVAQQSGTFTWEVATDGLYTHVSHVVEQVTGHRPEELIGRKHFYDLHPESGREEFKAAAFEVFEQKEPFRNLENAIQTKDGRIVWVSTYGLPRLNKDGTLRGYRGGDTDITERKRAEEALRESQQMQAKAEELAATGRMAAQVAHEINNPLAGIKNSFHLIRNAVPEDHPDYDMVGRIDREIDRIAHIVRQMYKLYSPRAQTPTDVPVEETIRDVFVMLQPLCREHEVTIELAPVSPKLIVRAPEGSLQQILHNLTANAIQVSPRSSVLDIVAEPVDKDCVRISIRDYGPGIPAEVEDQIFEPFFSAETGGGTEEGLGLGLAIVKNVAELIGGRIEFESRLGKGTCFHVYLPST